MAETGIDIKKAAALLKQGQLVAIPTETVYGLAANALLEKSVLGIFEAKNRPFFDPLIVHVHSLNEVKRYAYCSNEKLMTLAQRFWPGPLTLLLPKKDIIPDIVTSGLHQVALRVPNHPVALDLLKQLDFPLAAPSANPFGYISPTRPEHVNAQMGDKIPYILDGGACQIGIESTIVGEEQGKIAIYRLGGTSVEEIEKIVGPVAVRLNLSGNPKAPGQLKSHYAPGIPLLFGHLESFKKQIAGKNTAVITFGKSPENSNNTTYYTLSEKMDLNEAALNLFSLLRLLDKQEYDLIIAEPLPDKGLGRAINDRLRRAASSF